MEVLEVILNLTFRFLVLYFEAFCGLLAMALVGEILMHLVPDVGICQ